MHMQSAKNVSVAAVVLAALIVGGCASSDKPAPPAKQGDSDKDSTPARTKEQPVAQSPSVKADPQVIIETSMGTMKAELWPDRSPKTVANFLEYVEAGYYDGLVFHRVIPGFMIQGGGFSPDMRQKPARGPIVNEARSDVKNARGTLAMARTNDVNSATAQFFINVVDNAFLDHRDNTPRGFGYCVFGKVTEGMDVADKIVATPTTTVAGYPDVPAEPIVIKSIRLASAPAKP
jgi:cyclophilin family peptidyl-prolyl cis-trans isomerase